MSSKSTTNVNDKTRSRNKPKEHSRWRSDGSSNGDDDDDERHTIAGDVSADVMHRTTLDAFSATEDSHLTMELQYPSEQALDSAMTSTTVETARESHPFLEEFNKNEDQELCVSSEVQCNMSPSSPSRNLLWIGVKDMNPFNAFGIDHLSSRLSQDSGDGLDSIIDSGKDEAKAARARLGMLRIMLKTKGAIPKEALLKRAERFSVATLEEGENVVPTKLHGLCAGADTTLLQLQTELAVSPASVSMQDSLGRLPLHVLGDNVDLVSTPLGKVTATTFALQLMTLYPEAITTPDSAGLFPFVSLIQDWEHWSYMSHDDKERGSSKMSELLGRVANAVAAGTGIDRSGPSLKPHASVSTAEGSTNINLTAMNLFPRVELWDEVGWCFEMLSHAMDELDGKNSCLHEMDRNLSEDLNKKDIESRTLLAKHLPLVMPTIIKTVLLVDGGGGDGARKRLLQSSIFRAMLLQPESVGDWLTSMIRKEGPVSMWAIDYLALVSETTIDDHTGVFRPSMPVDKEEFHLARLEVFNAIDALDGTIASLVILQEREIERAASTSVIWFLMSKNLARPFVFSLALIDFVLQIVLLLAFRKDVLANTADRQFTSRIVVYFICGHYLIRKGCESIALFNLSAKVFRSYILNLWNVFDILAIIMVLGAYSWNQANPNSYRTEFNTILLGLLWLKILAFLKVVNEEMSTFILSLFRILKDLVYFSIVLLVVIFMFSDMFRVVISTEDDGAFCLLENATGTLPEGPIQDFCNPETFYSVLRTYAILLGDFELDDYMETPGMTVLFVIFTAIGVIILLNVLIAVISDSYQVSKLNSHRVFGRARVGFVAQNQALESFLRPGAKPVVDWNIKSPTKALVTGLAFLRWGVLLSLLVTAAYTAFYLVKQAIASFNSQAYLAFLVALAVTILLTCALWILTFFAFGGVALAWAPGFIVRFVWMIDMWSRSFSRAMASRLFGISRSERMTHSTVDEDNGEDEWQGKMTNIEKSFDRTANRIRDELKAELTSEMKAEIADLKKCLFEHGWFTENTQAPKT